MKSFRLSEQHRKGFTLLEAMVAAVIGGFIALVAVGSLRTVTAAKEIVEFETTTTDELRFAANMIRTDLANLYRDKNRQSVKLVGIIEETDYGLITSLTLRVVGTVKARFDQPEGDVYEVQYYLHKDEEKSALMRRLCPIVGVEEEGDTEGGILTLIAENIVDFRVRYYDGSEWLDFWSEEEDSMPKLVEVALMAQASEESRRKGLKSKVFTVDLPRLGQMTVQNANIETEEKENR